jgi:predicted secreted protein
MKIPLALVMVALGSCQSPDAPPAKDVSTREAPSVVRGASPKEAGASSALSVLSASAAWAIDGVAASGSPTNASGDAVYDQTTTAVDARVGDHFSVVVPGNATSSYTWKADAPVDATVLTVAEPKYTPQPPPDCNGRCLGYGGTYSFRVTANAAGSAKLHLVKIHVGRVPGAPVQEVGMTVTVK